jgi:predicted O-linked N-acetylglucosamine transferase (SPINDLY family)
VSDFTTAQTIFQSAISALNLRRFDDAERLFKTMLAKEPGNFAALNLLTAVLMSRGRFAEAEAFITRALKINQGSAASFYNYGIILKMLGKPRPALEQFDRALALDPNACDAWNSRGTVRNDLKDYDRAIADFDKALSIDPNCDGALCNKGKSLSLLKRHDEALAAYDSALRLKPDLLEAWLGRGTVLREQQLRGEALAAYIKALALAPDAAEARLGRAFVLADLNRSGEALADYDKALQLKPGLAGGWNGRGNLLAELKRFDEALAAYDRALAVKPDLAEAWLGRGNVFRELKRYEDAFAAYDKALAAKPDFAEARVCRADGLRMLGRYAEATADYEKALALAPDLPGIEGMRLHCKMLLCDWRDVAAEREHLIAAVRQKKANATPFAFYNLSASPEDQLDCARSWSAAKYPALAPRIWQGPIYRHERIRVAYVSADFHQHATAYLAAGLFECHDKSRFDITAISVGQDDASEMRGRLKQAFDQFIEARALSDDAIAERVRSAEIDILVDLKGFTQDARTGVFARRPAPIQVNYLGFPATMGADYIDYLIADRIVVPASHKAHYAEKIAYVPGSYQINDAKRPISGRSFARAELGLPDTGFVFCCFNNNFKIFPDVFACWMRLLKQREDSVLWLLEDNAGAAANLRQEARMSGVDPDRLVFAKRAALPEHLARHRAADLFLDTLPYNAHTTASDALWAGVPVLTQIGETFAGRVAASLLRAVGLPELITETRGAYEQRALDLATHPAELSRLREKLAQTRLSAPLFDTRSSTRHLERAYLAMYERYQAGLPPDHIDDGG